MHLGCGHGREGGAGNAQGRLLLRRDIHTQHGNRRSVYQGDRRLAGLYTKKVQYTKYSHGFGVPCRLARMAEI